MWDLSFAARACLHRGMDKNQPLPAPLWIFGYGSLIWHPGFTPARQELAVLQGWHRSFCMRSIHHRGTETAPGLVLALDAQQGASCAGVAFQVAPGEEPAVMAELRARELVSSAYLEAVLPVTLASGAVVQAVTYVIDPDHVQYCGGLPLDEQAQIIAAAVGGRGPNAEYLFNTAHHLAELGLPDAELAALASQVRALIS
jgi:glutathione-specific gamma-glutamylcyclotransferase